MTIASIDAAAGQEAKRRIEEPTASVEVGMTCDGIPAQAAGLRHDRASHAGQGLLLQNSRIAIERVNAVADNLSEGQLVCVKDIETDERGP